MTKYDYSDVDVTAKPIMRRVSVKKARQVEKVSFRFTAEMIEKIDGEVMRLSGKESKVTRSDVVKEIISQYFNM